MTTCYQNIFNGNIMMESHFNIVTFLIVILMVKFWQQYFDINYVHYWCNNNNNNKHRNIHIYISASGLYTFSMPDIISHIYTTCFNCHHNHCHLLLNECLCSHSSIVQVSVQQCLTRSPLHLIVITLSSQMSYPYSLSLSHKRYRLVLFDYIPT